MKQFKFLPAIATGICMVFLFYSCGSGGESSTESTSDSTAIDTSSSMTTQETPSEAKPSNVLLMKFKVADFAKWKTGYESHDSIRRSYGLTNYVLGRGSNDSNVVLVFLKMDDVNKAKELTSSEGIKDRMKKGGVLGKPSFDYVDVVMDDNTPIDENARVMVSHKVKDFDAWKKSFDSGKQDRVGVGLIDRGLGYSDGDNHMVSVVFAITDKKKAEDFMKSKDLKDKMTEAGVEGPPTFFYYNIVQKY